MSIFKTISASLDKKDFLFEVNAIVLLPLLLTISTKFLISVVDPLFEINKTTSFLSIIPESP